MRRQVNGRRWNSFRVRFQEYLQFFIECRRSLAGHTPHSVQIDFFTGANVLLKLRSGGC
jgi:hypothetical protein